MQEYEMAKVAANILGTKASEQQPQRSCESKCTPESRVEDPNHMGMSTLKDPIASEPNPEVLDHPLISVELFAGAGGLALGTEMAGFKHHTVVERDKYCCDTIRENQSRGFQPLNGWRLFQGDVRDFDFDSVNVRVDLLAGGPPCQPFSIGGKHAAFNDERDMFPQVVRAVRALRPKAIIIENVKGLTRKSFANYFSYIVFQLSHPEITRRSEESWFDHRNRLEKYHTKGSWSGLEYRIVPRLLNSANFGVPQKRERVFFVGFRSDIAIEWTFPEESHSLEALLHEQFVSGNYWDRYKIPRRLRPTPPARLLNKLEALSQPSSLFDKPLLPWQTVRDCLVGLPDPESPSALKFWNHRLNPGAKAYVGHTGSPLDEPAKTLKAGDHGVPGGENALLKPDGSLRYFTVREAARIQTFPDEYVFHGAWSESMRQLGNAVPVSLARIVAEGVKQKLSILR